MWCVWEVAALPRTLAVCSQVEHTSPGWDVYTYVLGTLLCVSGRHFVCQVDATGWMFVLLCVSCRHNRMDADNDTALCVR